MDHKKVFECFVDDDDDDVKCDMCSCSNCGWEGYTSVCETDTESDGWEYPTYIIHLCPVCEDGGCIDNYWYKQMRSLKDE